MRGKIYKVNSSITEQNWVIKYQDIEDDWRYKILPLHPDDVNENIVDNSYIEFEIIETYAKLKN
jgi:hypothetical protein